MTREDALAAAWALANQRGLVGFELDDLAERLGVDVGEVTTMFPSMDALYDALFADAHHVFRERFYALPATDDAREELRMRIHAFARFAAEDNARHQLLYQRVIPGFEPSPDTYALAIETLEATIGNLRALGITEPAHADLLTALINGIVTQQIANDPGGDRWLRLIDLALDMYLDTREVRRRLVAAQDQERRRIERDLHDGVQQHLIALKVAAGTARTVAERENATRTAQLLSTFADDASVALDTLRELARGIYPPLLAAEGIAAALSGAAARAPMPVEIHAEGLSRYSEDVEAAVYFCCLEALQNVAKYAGASKATVRFELEPGVLVFRVIDDGAGFDVGSTPRGSGTANMADRVGALGGTLIVESRPGAGTTVCGRVPV